jgi:hypothetical protein
MNQQVIGGAVLAVGLLAVAVGVVRWWVKQPDHPAALAPAPALTAPSELQDPLVRALRAEMSSLKVYLFFLPFIWSIIWGVLYAIYASLR